jgi:hypothetical protein
MPLRLAKRFFLLLLSLALFSGVAVAARLPGVKTPSKNISCFYVPRPPTTHANLICNIRSAAYTRALQERCIAPPTGLDWHGFLLSDTKRGELLCAGGIMYNPRDTPTFVTLAYGQTWRHAGFTCKSRVTGLTCTSAAGHGLFLSRASWRTW